MAISGVRQLAAAVREKIVSPRDLVEESLRRIDAANGQLNAVVRLRAEAALEEADALDDKRRNGPLAGVPLLVKDLTDVAGLPTTYGSPLYADASPAAADASIVARLRAAGAIVVGKTNTPAFGWTAFTDNLVYGATRNPWNHDRAPGGSSGGSAAALAAGLAPLATTTDGGGSVRIPASMCGLVGYKPTIGVIGRDRAPRWMGFSTSGATNASVADAVLEMSVLAGPTGTDINELPPGAVALEPARPPARRRVPDVARRCRPRGRGRVRGDAHRHRGRPRTSRRPRRTGLRRGRAPDAVVHDQFSGARASRWRGAKTGGTSSNPA